ncbi:MAG: VOC family protein, partial [Thermoplasmata archaeon]|nr:VOC family protein [Thermoplasmata archaeon]
TFLYSGLRVRHLARSTRFYERLGFKRVSGGKMEHGGIWVHFRYPGTVHELELNYYPKGNRFYEGFRRGTEFDHLGFYAPDMDAWMRLVKRAGAKVVAEFREGKQRLIYVQDPDGNWVEAFGPATPHPKRKKKK